MKVIALLMCICAVSILFFSQPATAAGGIRIAKYGNDCKGAISFTFDDGFKKEVDDALKIIDPLGVRGTFFVIPGKMATQKGSRATWAQLKLMMAKGHEIGNHSMTHPKLHTCDDKKLDHEVNTAYDLIKKNLGKAPYTFCFPGGSQRWFERIPIAAGLPAPVPGTGYTGSHPGLAWGSSWLTWSHWHVDFGAVLRAGGQQGKSHQLRRSGRDGRHRGRLILCSRRLKDVWRKRFKIHASTTKFPGASTVFPDEAGAGAIA